MSWVEPAPLITLPPAAPRPDRLGRRVGAAVLAAVLAFGGLQPGFATPRPVGERPDIKTSEGALWAQSDKAELAAKASGELNRDPALNAEVKTLVCKIAATYCGEVRVYVMDRPYFNASMAPNGYMEVWSGLLLRADSEAELAFVLGHEIGHFKENHSIESWKEAQARLKTAQVFSIALALAGIPIIGDLAYLGTVASLFGFSREAETEADALGFQAAIDMGYDPSAGASLWRNLIAEVQSSDLPKVRERMARASIFNTHPVSSERVAALEALAKDKPAGQSNSEAYRALIRPHLSAWLRDDLRRRDFGTTLAIIQRKQKTGEDLGVLTFFEGEIYRLRRGANDADLALATYKKAVGFADVPADAYRELGEALARKDQREEAVMAFETYLERAPNAKDHLLIKARLGGLKPVPPPVPRILTEPPPGLLVPVAPSPALTDAPANPMPLDPPKTTPEPVTATTPGPAPETANTP